jgi:hypothetical protein
MSRKVAVNKPILIAFFLSKEVMGFRFFSGQPAEYVICE